MIRDDVMDTSNVYSYGIDLSKFKLDLPKSQNKPKHPAKRYVCIDIEMSELTASQKQMVSGLRNEVIQIGAVMLDENYNMISEFNSYVKPCYSSVTPLIHELTGITNEKLEKADDFITAFDKYNYWLRDAEITTFCWSKSDFTQLWNELELKVKHRTDLFVPLKNFVDLQQIYCDQIGAEIPVSLEAALKFLQLDYQGQIHTANCDAFNTARILHKIFCTKGLKPSIEYISSTKAPRIKNETKKVLDKVRAKDNDNNCSFAAFLSPELLAQFGYVQKDDTENLAVDSFEHEDTVISTSPLAYLAKELSFTTLCNKYRVLKSKWIQFATEVMDTQEMQVA